MTIVILIIVLFVIISFFKLSRSKIIIRPPEDEVVSILDHIKADMNIFTSYIKNMKYPKEQKSKISGKLRFPYHVYFQNLLERYKYTEIRESNSKTYTVNKQEINICLGNPDNGKLDNYNTTLYAVIHELTHLAMPDYSGHSEEFFLLLDHLLDKAVECGIYQKTNFNFSPDYHCGELVNK